MSHGSGGLLHQGVLEELVLITTPSNKLHLKIYIEGEYIITQKN